MSNDTNPEAFIAAQRKKLFAELSEIDERLIEFRKLLAKFSGSRADFSLESIDHLERLLIRLQANTQDHTDLLLDAAYYIGETLRRRFQGRWDVGEEASDEHPDALGAPLITGHSKYEDYYPFEDVFLFAGSPREGFFRERILAQVQPEGA